MKFGFFVTPCCGWSMYAIDKDTYMCKNCGAQFTFDELLIT